MIKFYICHPQIQESIHFQNWKLKEFRTNITQVKGGNNLVSDKFSSNANCQLQISFKLNRLIKRKFIFYYLSENIYLCGAKVRLHYEKTRRFRIRLAGFMNLKIFSLEIKWPILMQKHCVFVVV